MNNAAARVLIVDDMPVNRNHSLHQGEWYQIRQTEVLCALIWSGLRTMS